MTPKEKAKELQEKYLTLLYGSKPFYKNSDYLKANKCAIICVNEIINSNPHSNPFNTDVESTMSYWLEVKNEIYKLK